MLAKQEVSLFPVITIVNFGNLLNMGGDGGQRTR
jgi:hypothetical protein